jgi:deoxyribose-phosphate aldolase
MFKYEYADKIINRIHNADVLYSNISNICYESIVNGFWGIEVFPNMVEHCKKIITGAHVSQDSNVKILTLISYPHGTFLPEQKRFEIIDALSMGAHGVNVCINNLNVRSGEWKLIQEEMFLAREASQGKILSFNIEMEYLTDEQISRCCEIAVEAKLDGIITSTGLYNTLDKNKNDVPLWITEKDIKKIKAVTADNIKIIAQGYIDSKEKIESMVKTGADYVGIENVTQIIHWQN